MEACSWGDLDVRVLLMPSDLWAKLEFEADRPVRWHALVDHSADVAAVMAVLLAQPTIRQRLAVAARRPELDDVTCARLVALAFLHDIGKANRGFQARSNPRAPNVGHINELAWLFDAGTPAAQGLGDRLFEVLGLDRVALWFSDEEASASLVDAVFSHHGRPWSRAGGGQGETPPLSRRYWDVGPDGDPIGRLSVMRDKLDTWMDRAFTPGPHLPDAPAFQHAFAGLLMLADWLGSDQRFFPFANGGVNDRFPWAKAAAERAMSCVGLAVEDKRTALRALATDFSNAFNVAGERPIQRAVGAPRGQRLVLEAETGSGKTEAALWRFKLLFEQGLVDGLYFALPTRVAATQIFARVKAFRDRIFPEAEKPGVVLAVPGQARFDEAQAELLPKFHVQWSDAAEHADERWAAERPKRFLAATISVGTIDQALLAAVRVKHAHLRGSALLRHLLVVDEVHASDIYSGTLLRHLLDAHEAAGGHALLLSATLGSAMKAHLLGTPPLSMEEAVNVPYPLLSWAQAGNEMRMPVEREGAAPKTVGVEPAPILAEAAVIAARALDAARRGAAVMVIRNTVFGAIAVAKALEELAGKESALLFRVGDVPTVHHARFAVEDRALLDAEVEARLGKGRPCGRGMVVVGTQTLEISLDLDADLLLTDLAPIDVLLQRIGRLHRHKRKRPAGFEEPRIILLTPADRDLIQRPEAFTRFGLGVRKDGDGIYADLRVIEATLRLAERYPAWTIPEMNRLLVEEATHPERLSALEAEDPRWSAVEDAREKNDNRRRRSAHSACLDRTRPFSTCHIPRDEILGTRLGFGDRMISFDRPRRGPFGTLISAVRLPGFLSAGISPEAAPSEVVEDSGGLSFRLGDVVFQYARWGLLKVG